MARISGVDLPNNKRIEVALTYIFGIGDTGARKILAAAKVSPDTRVKDLTDEEINVLRQTIEKNFKVEGDLRTEVAMNIKRLMDIGCYRVSVTEGGCRSAVRTRRTTQGLARAQKAVDGKEEKYGIVRAQGEHP